MAFKKKIKNVAPWHQNILSHHHPKLSAKDRGEFPLTVIEELIIEAEGKCQSCFAKRDTITHHVMPRGRQGRGVKTNGLRCCIICHDQIHRNEVQLQHWIHVYQQRYGAHFWFDEEDWDEYNRKQAVERETEKWKNQQLMKLKPIIDTLSKATSRDLQVNEIDFLLSLNKKEITILVNMMQDIAKL
ncbi:HNH endonuclease [Paenibacillus cremeus]|uniref:HNH endonuclease n=1 Tax=Paenibacillus cremeus TaxID=2163881 RepID=A0A559K504_9BACL|nr:HNH endonuclease [Paenibacillus cremeus]TVY07187.1 HNH endonuclease [Paenibacillus cremeus]